MTTLYADPQLDLSPLAEVAYEPEQSLAERFAARFETQRLPAQREPGAES